MKQGTSFGKCRGCKRLRFLNYRELCKRCNKPEVQIK